MSSVFKNDEFQYPVKFSNGEFVTSRKQLPWKVKAIDLLYHQDVKTMSIRDDRPYIDMGDEVLLVDIWTNFYGIWAKVQDGDGQYIDVRPIDLEVISV